jgi:hypothetical protein
MKTELIQKLEELLLKDAGEVATDVRTLQKEYQKQRHLEFEKARQSFIEEGGTSKEFDLPADAEDKRFDELLGRYQQLRKEQEAKIAAEQTRNLIIRQEIIAKIKDLSQLSENVGAAIKMLGELQKQWKEVGQVSPHKYKEIQSEYSKAIEDIYYNIKIFRDLQEHDLKKNYEHKSELIEKLKALQQLDNIKEAERLIKVYRNEWEEIGPVPNMKWEELKQSYKTVLDEAYLKIKTFYHSMEEVKEQNLKIKQELVEKAKAIIEKLDEHKLAKWNEATEKLIALQNEWKTVGRTTEKDNEKVWTEFRSICDTFFANKKVFFAGLHESFAANRKIKSDLIAKAEALKDSTDWQKTGLDLIRLQDEWKKHPSGGDKEEPRLYAKFRKACNHFFDAKKQHFESLNASFEGNLSVKEALLKKLLEFTPAEDGQQIREQLRSFNHDWIAAGHVPLKDKKRLNDAFYNRLDELYEQLHMDKQEKAKLQFRSKLDRLAASENALDLLRKEADHLRKQEEEIKGRVRTYDNNLGFFKSSKGGNAFLQEIQDKIELEKSRMQELSDKRKLVNEEINKLREPVKTE